MLKEYNGLDAIKVSFDYKIQTVTSDENPCYRVVTNQVPAGFDTCQDSDDWKEYQWYLDNAY